MTSGRPMGSNTQQPGDEQEMISGSSLFGDSLAENMWNIPENIRDDEEAELKLWWASSSHHGSLMAVEFWNFSVCEEFQ